MIHFMTMMEQWDEKTCTRSFIYVTIAMSIINYCDL